MLAKIILTVIVALSGFVAPVSAQSQYPDKDISWIVPFCRWRRLRRLGACAGPSDGEGASQGRKDCGEECYRRRWKGRHDAALSSEA